MINSIIIDDEPLAREGISDYVRRTPFLNLIADFENPLNAVSTLTTQNIDLIFLDMHMPEMTGLDFISTLKAPPLTIIITAYPDYALRGYELNILDYILKPVSFERFLKASNKAKDYYEFKHDLHGGIGDYFFIKSNLCYEKIFVDDVLYIEGKQNYVTIHTTGKQYLTHMTLKYLEETLPKRKFVRIHRSYLVGIKHISRIEGNILFIKDQQLPVSRDNKDEILDKILTGKLLKGD